MPLRVAAPKRLCREPLWTLGDQRKCPLDSSRMWDSRLSARTDSGFHAADRLEVAKLGADLSKAYVQYKQRWTLPSDKAVNVTLNPRRLARIYFPYGRHIRFVRILSPTTELHPGRPEGLPLVMEIHKRTATGPLMRRHAQWHNSRKMTVRSFFHLPRRRRAPFLKLKSF